MRFDTPYCNRQCRRDDWGLSMRTAGLRKPLRTVTAVVNSSYCQRFPDEVADFLIALPAHEAWQALQDIPVGDSGAVWTQLPTDVAEAILVHADDTYLGDLFTALDPVYAAGVLRRADTVLRARILERLTPAVVNISTSQVGASSDETTM